LGNFVFDQEGEFRDRCILINFEIKSKRINRILVYPLQIKNAVPQFFSNSLSSVEDSIQKAFFIKHLKSLSKGVIFEEVKQNNSSFSTYLIQRK